jgi:hypothetical protein
MHKTILTDAEEKMLVGLLYNHLSFGTTLEVFGELSPDGIKRLTDLRNIFGKLLKKYSLADKIDQQTYLLLGMTDFLKKERLKSWSRQKDNKHLEIRAKYFLKKYQERKNTA